MTIRQALRSLLLYPINGNTVDVYLTMCDLDGENAFTHDISKSAQFKRAQAKCYMYFAESPQVSEAGQSYNFTDAQRAEFRRKANALLAEIGEEDVNDGTITVGWISENF